MLLNVIELNKIAYMELYLSIDVSCGSGKTVLGLIKDVKTPT
jgi:hypothetical protein